MTNDDVVFDGMVDSMVSEDANRVLDRQIGQARAWRTELAAEGGTPSLHLMIHHILAERNSRRHVLVAYSAALWRLMEREDRENGAV